MLSLKHINLNNYGIKTLMKINTPNMSFIKLFNLDITQDCLKILEKGLDNKYVEIHIKGKSNFSKKTQLWLRIKYNI